MPIPEPESPRQMSALTNEQKELLMAQRNEETARLNLVQMQQLLQASLVTQGKFEEAKAEGVDAAPLDIIAAAIEKADDDICEHRDYRVISQRVWSEKHQGFVLLQECVVCGDLNALPELIVPV